MSHTKNVAVSRNYRNMRSLASEAKFYEGYSRFIPELNRHETWNESVDRVMKMHDTFFTKKGKMSDALKREMAKAREGYINKSFLGAQRALQFGGDQLLKHHARLYNCCSSYADRPEFFGETFYMLLCGCGVGFSVQKQHIEKLPAISLRDKQAKTHVIDDSIEGWATALDVLLSSYFVGGGKHPEYEGRKVYFDYINIRAKGEMISGGFAAPGPEPLMLAMNKIENMLNKIAHTTDKLSPINVYDIVMHFADAVIAGGVRRSATICLFSHDDEEMAKAKTGDWYRTNPQRGRSNNSAVLIRGKVTKDEFESLMTSVQEFGEPGFYFVDDPDIMTNPCVTADTIINTETGLRRVEDLIGRPFKAMVNGKSYSSNGFFKTGNKPVYRIATSRGHHLDVTENHKILIDNGNGEEWVETKDLMAGDSIVLNKNSTYRADQNSNDFKKGWLIGSMIGDGGHNPEKYPSYCRFWGNRAEEYANKARSYITDLSGDDLGIQEYNNIFSIHGKYLTHLGQEFITSYDKDIKNSVFYQSDDFLAGVIQGYFDADGTIFGSPKSKGIAIRLASNNKLRLKIMQVLLHRFGITSTIYDRREEGEYILPDGKGSEKKYKCKKMYDLHFSRENVNAFNELCGFGNFEKQEKLLNLISMKTKSAYRDVGKTDVVSIEFLKNDDVYDCTINEVHRFEANGMIIHNCVEIGMYPKTVDGRSGFQGCNLVEINGSYCDTPEKFYEACEAAAIMGTLQAAYTDFKFLSPTSKEIFDREALIGVSITGWTANPKVLLNKEIVRKGVEIVRETNIRVAKIIGINPAARLTCVKPSGNASVLLGTPSGIHGEHAPMYIRNTQVNKESPVGKFIKSKFPEMVEESRWSANGTDWVISYPVISTPDSIFKYELLGVKQLEIVKFAQENWVIPGTNLDFCVNKAVRHNVSNTIQVDDWREVSEYIWKHHDIFAGISLLGMSGDKSYVQAPFTEVLTEDKIIEKYGSGAMFASGLIVDAIHVFDDLWFAINSVKFGVNDGDKKPMQLDWVRRFHKFADNFFDGDIEKTELCLKDVHLLHRWFKIQSAIRNTEFSWEEMQSHETLVDADTLAAAACQGGACEI